jgi:hypothetical protein
LTIGIIAANPTPKCVYLDSRALHKYKYGIASEHECGVGPRLGLSRKRIFRLRSEPTARGDIARVYLVSRGMVTFEQLQSNPNKT